MRTDDREGAARAAAQLDEYVVADPTIVEQLAGAPPPGRTPAPSAAAGGQPEEPPQSRIEQFEEFLAYEFALAAGLRRAVALPGFFNCTDCVAVIDARPEEYAYGSGRLHPPELDRGTFSPPIEEQTLWLETQFRRPTGRPRVWLIPTKSAERRDKLTAALDARFSADPPLSTITLHSFHSDRHALWALLTDGERVQRVKGINRDRVIVVEEDRAGTDLNFYAIRRPAGIKLLRDALAALVAEQARDAIIWEQELRKR